MQSPTLNTQKKKSLRGVAHHLDPVIAVSERGITHGIVDETERALSDHELIKVKVFGIDRASRDEIASAAGGKNRLDRAAKNRQSRCTLPTQPQS